MDNSADLLLFEELRQIYERSGKKIPQVMDRLSRKTALSGPRGDWETLILFGQKNSTGLREEFMGTILRINKELIVFEGGLFSGFFRRTDDRSLFRVNTFDSRASMCFWPQRIGTFSFPVSVTREYLGERTCLGIDELRWRKMEEVLNQWLPR